MLADKSDDSNALRAIIAQIGAEAVTPSIRTRKLAIPHDEIASSTSVASVDAFAQFLRQACVCARFIAVKPDA